MSDDVDLAGRFLYHAPDENRILIHQDLRREFLNLALLVHLKCPPGRERSLAFTKLEEGMFWANAAISRKP